MKPSLGAVLLAAGGSRRLGRPKQLIEIGGEPLVRRAALTLLALEPAATVAVVGADAAAVGAALADLPLEVRENPTWSAGMGGSIATGVAALPRWLDGVLLMPCDLWRIEPRDLQALVATWHRDPACITLARWPGASGPPVVFPARLFARLEALRGEQGGRAVIEADRQDARFVDIANAGDDLDTPADLARARAEGPPHPDGI